jgi:hypothetical protein
MDIQLKIGTVRTELYGNAVDVEVYLRELDSDCGPMIQVGDEDDNSDYDNLEDFMRDWQDKFTPVPSHAEHKWPGPLAPGTVMTPKEAAEGLIAAIDKAQDVEQTSDLANAYREAARQHARDGELEVDDHAIVSFSDDEGSYVAAWIWVTDEEAGIKNCSACERMEINPADAEDWGTDEHDNVLCPECAAGDEVLRIGNTLIEYHERGAFKKVGDSDWQTCYSLTKDSPRLTREECEADAAAKGAKARFFRTVQV